MENQHKQIKPYIKFPSKIRPHDTMSWKVADLCKAYNFPIGMTPGATIGILELGGSWSQSDLDQFSHLNGLPTIAVQDVSVGGGQKEDYDANPDANGEVLLDIEVAAASYYYCTGAMPVIKVLWAPNTSDAFVSVINEAVSQGCDVLSISWGSDEANFTAQQARSLESAAIAATAKGMVIFAASGDNSSDDNAPNAQVDIPSGCPHVVACGGTAKTLTAETVWGDGTPNGSGTGGGFSHLFPTQSWQLHAPIHPGRMVPDVAACADPNTGYRVVVDGQEQTVGGTSAVAPFYAGLFAALGRNMGFVTPTLWKNPKCFTDITRGSNGAFHAAVGPDACTGLGVPYGTELAAVLAQK